MSTCSGRLLFVIDNPPMYDQILPKQSKTWNRDSNNRWKFFTLHQINIMYDLSFYHVVLRTLLSGAVLSWGSSPSFQAVHKSSSTHCLQDLSLERWLVSSHCLPHSCGLIPSLHLLCASVHLESSAACFLCPSAIHSLPMQICNIGSVAKHAHSDIRWYDNVVSPIYLPVACTGSARISAHRIKFWKSKLSSHHQIIVGILNLTSYFREIYDLPTSLSLNFLRNSPG